MFGFKLSVKAVVISFLRFAELLQLRLLSTRVAPCHCRRELGLRILTGNQSSEALLNGQWCTGSAFMQWKKTSLRSRLSCQMPGRKTPTDRLLQ